MLTVHVDVYYPNRKRAPPPHRRPASCVNFTPRCGSCRKDNYKDVITLKGVKYTHVERTTSVMIIIVGASPSEQHTDLLICHRTKQDLSHASRYLGMN